MSDSHLYKALAWKLLWSYRRKKILLFLTTIFAVLLSSITFYAGPYSATEFMEKISIPITPEQLMSVNQKTDIKYAPKSMETKKIMKEVGRMLKKSSLKSLSSTEEVEKEFIEEKNQKNENETENNFSYGVIFEHVSKNELKYSLRSTLGKGWETKKLTRINEDPNEVKDVYFLRNFVALQNAINSGYLTFLGVKGKKWYLQEFPYPKQVLRDKFTTEFTKTFTYGVTPLYYCMIKFIMDEKSSGARDIMILNGFKLHFIYFYWIIFFMIPFLIVITTAMIMAVIFENLYYSSAFLFWLLLFVFLISSMAMIFALTAIFKNTTFAMLFYFIPLAGVINLLHYTTYTTLSFKGILTVVTPGGSLVQGIEMIAFYESAGVGITFHNILTVNKSLRHGPYLCIIVAPLILAILMVLLSVYLNLVRPGQYRRARPWYFIFPKCLTRRLRAVKEFPRRSRGPSPVMENVELEGEIRVRSLYKVFKNFTALNNFSLDFYKGQITSLLGHNGAGKTTFLFTITGIISPTSGEIFYQDYDVLLNFNKFRKSFGFCPQQNIVIEDLSVQEQILFFGMVKKMSKDETRKIAESLFQKFNMSDKQDVVPSKLSGGQKRKLCLAIAVINDPPVVFLDEPSSGLDPESRRNLWDTVLNLRKERTIVITTHFMEEADVLGDRIAIMAHGELRCYGSPIFLKKHYGFGHTISINYKRNNPEEITSMVNSYVNATNEIDPNKKQITFNVPMEGTPKLSALFAALDSIVARNRLSVSCSSLENVFLKVQESEGITTEFDETDVDFVAEKRNKNRGRAQCYQQIGSLLHKRALHMKDQWILFIGLLYVAPITVMILSMLVWNSTNISVSAMNHSLVLELSLYGETDVIITGTGNISKSFQNLIESQGSTAVLTDISAFNELMSKAEEHNFQNRNVVAGDFSNETSILFYSSMAYHSAPIAVNLYFNSFLQSENLKTSISITNYPFEFASVCQKIDDSRGPWAVMIIMLLYSMCVFNFFPMREKEVGIKHLQYMAELKPLTYWISNLIFDLTLCFISIFIITLIIYFMDIHKFYTDLDLIIGIFLAFYAFSIYIMLLGYFLSIVIRGYDIASSIIFFGVILLWGATLIVGGLVEKSASYLYWLNLITPIRSLYDILVFIDVISFSRQLCQVCTNFDEDECKDDNSSVLLNKKFTLNIIWLLGHGAFVLLLTILFDYKLIEYIKWTCTRKWYKETGQELDEDVQREKDAVKEYLAGQPWRRSDRDKKLESEQKEKGSETPKEKKMSSFFIPSNAPMTSTTVSEMSISDDSETPPVIIVDRLTKMYSRSFVAADQVTFAVMRKQCFGLLGVSGAGKSTVFCMLTGRIYPTMGTAFVIDDDKKYQLKIRGFDFIHKMGYCPQEYWIHGYLTARQMITHFAHLRGIKQKEIKSIVDRWIKILDLHNYCDKPCGIYSGGNKRKLNTALALVGEPIVVLLDEPTTGVDPVARRKLWQVFRLVKNSDQAMILTSHSMDECEAICNNLAIMAKGKVRCIGEINYLKNKFAQGCTIFIKFGVSDPPEISENIKNDMMSTFTNCELVDQQLGFLHFRINEKHVRWSEMFSKMEQIKKTFKEIEEYMLSDTSLEQIFLSFAEK